MVRPFHMLNCWFGERYTKFVSAFMLVKNYVNKVKK